MTESKVKISYKFNDVSAADKELIEKRVQQNIDGKLDSYLKKVFAKKDDAEVTIKYTVTFHDDTKKYDADFIFAYDGEDFVYKKQGFRILNDLVNHAFQHFKEKLSRK